MLISPFLHRGRILLLAAWAMSLVACHAYLYTEVTNDSPQSCRISCGEYSNVLKPGETMDWPLYLPDNDMPVVIYQGMHGDLAVRNFDNFRQMAQWESGRLWSTFYVIPYVRGTLVLCHDDAGRLTWRKK